MSDSTCDRKCLVTKLLLARLKHKEAIIEQLESKLALASLIMRLLIVVASVTSVALALTAFGVTVL